MQNISRRVRSEAKIRPQGHKALGLVIKANLNKLQPKIRFLELQPRKPFLQQQQQQKPNLIKSLETAQLSKEGFQVSSCMEFQSISCKRKQF